MESSLARILYKQGRTVTGLSVLSSFFNRGVTCPIFLCEGQHSLTIIIAVVFKIFGNSTAGIHEDSFGRGGGSMSCPRTFCMVIFDNNSSICILLGNLKLIRSLCCFSPLFMRMAFMLRGLLKILFSVSSYG